MGLSYYEILEVSETASAETISAAYRSLSKRFHPDVCSNPSVVERFKGMTEAYSTLSDSSKRSAYDEALKEERVFAQQKAQYQSSQPPPSSQGPIPSTGFPVGELAVGLIDMFGIPFMPPIVAKVYAHTRGDVGRFVQGVVEGVK